MGIKETACGIGGHGMKHIRAVSVAAFWLAVGWAAHRVAVSSILDKFDRNDAIPVRDLKKLIA